MLSLQWHFPCLCHFGCLRWKANFTNSKTVCFRSSRAATFPYSKCPENGFPQTDPYYCEARRAFLRARGRCETSRGELYRGLALMRNAKPLADLSRAHVARGLVLCRARANKRSCRSANTKGLLARDENAKKFIVNITFLTCSFVRSLIHSFIQLCTYVCIHSIFHCWLNDWLSNLIM